MSDFLYCEALDADGTVYYITGVFSGDYGDSAEYGVQFSNHLRAMDKQLLNDGTCGFIDADSSADAQAAHNQHINQLQTNGYEISTIQWPIP